MVLALCHKKKFYEEKGYGGLIWGSGGTRTTDLMQNPSMGLFKKTIEWNFLGEPLGD